MAVSIFSVLCIRFDGSFSRDDSVRAGSSSSSSAGKEGRHLDTEEISVLIFLQENFRRSDCLPGLLPSRPYPE